MSILTIKCFAIHLPALNRFVVHGLRRKLGQLDAAHVGIGDVGEDRFRVAGVGIAHHHAALPEHGDRSARVLDVQPVMREAGGPLRVGRVQLEKRILADLHVDEPDLSLVVVDAKRFLYPIFSV